eukprot:gene1710-1869_t
MHILFKIPLYLAGLLVAQASPLWGALIVQQMGACLGVTVKGESGAIDFASWVPHKKRNTYFVRLCSISGAAPWMMLMPGMGCLYVFYPPLTALAILPHLLFSI